MREVPFLYNRLLYAIAADPGRYLLVGGPGMGKTTLLLRLHSLLRQEQHPSRLVRASDEDVQNQIEDWYPEDAGTPKGALLIDDLDRVYDEQMVGQFRRMQQDARENSEPLKIVATSSTPRSLSGQGLNEGSALEGSKTGTTRRPSWNMLVFDSRGLTQFEDEPLIPWSMGWHDRATTRVVSILTAAAPKLVDPKRIEDIAKEIATLTGAHPFLLGAATKHLARLYRGITKEFEKDTLAENPPSDQEVAIQELEQYLRVLATPLVERALLWAMNQVSDSAIRDLLTMARMEERTGGELTFQPILAVAGLVRETAGKHEIASPIIRKCLRELDLSRLGIDNSGSFSVSRISLIPDPNGETGAVAWHDGKNARRLELPQAEWEVLWRISLGEGEAISVKQLVAEDGSEDRTEEQKAARIRSAIARLQKSLKANGLEIFFVNVARKGYSINRNMLERLGISSDHNGRQRDRDPGESKE